MANSEEMGKKSLRLVGRLIRLLPALILIVAISGCVATKALTPAQKAIDKSKVSMSYTVDNATNVITVSTSDPVVLRTFIMQGFSLDLSGQYAYTIKVPSAKDVESKISHHPGEVKATMQGDSEKRPDIRPLLTALNQVDAPIYAKSGKVGKAKRFQVYLDTETGRMTYKITLSNTYSMDLPVNVTLKSTPIEGEQEFGNQFPNRNEAGRQQPFGVGQPMQPNDGQREMTIQFSFK